MFMIKKFVLNIIHCTKICTKQNYLTFMLKILQKKNRIQRFSGGRLEISVLFLQLPDQAKLESFPKTSSVLM